MSNGKSSAKAPILKLRPTRQLTTVKRKTRTIFLTGAPRRQDLKWRERDLTAPLLQCFGGTSFGANGVAADEELGEQKTDAAVLHKREEVVTGNERLKVAEQEEEAKCSSRDADFEPHVEEPQQPSILPRATFDDSILKDEDFFTQNRPPAKSFYMQKGFVSAKKLVKVKHCSITDLDLLVAQTVTPETTLVNVLGVILSLSTPRHVRTRSKSQSSLLELIVADETYSSFKISVWLSSGSSTSAEKELKARCGLLKVGDIILFDKLGVKSYRGKVDAQSTRGTKVWDITTSKCRWTEDVLNKAHRIRSWMVEHVAFASSALSKDGEEMMEVEEDDIDGVRGNKKERRSDPADSRSHRLRPTQSSTPRLGVRTRRGGRSAADELPGDTQAS